ncbi:MULTISPECIES: hypothetical protein [Peribacillus]|uniref:hypothetical protein n=1 Tax=Peribacillus TaxID=2675229 RepID=UPI00351D8176
MDMKVDALTKFEVEKLYKKIDESFSFVQWQKLQNKNESKPEEGMVADHRRKRTKLKWQ